MADSAETHVLEPYLPLLDKRSYVHAMCSETVRRSKLLEAMHRDYKRGDLAKLKASVQHCMLDSELAKHSGVLKMDEVLREAGAKCIICENLYRKMEEEKLRPSDVQALDKAVSKLEQLELGPELWKESKGLSVLYPKLPKVKDMLASRGNLKVLSEEFRGGSGRYCTAWLRAVEECQLTPKLETLTAKWFDAFPDSPQQLRQQLLEDDVRFSYDDAPWDERDELIPKVQEQLTELGISTTALTFRTTRSFGPEGGVVVVVTGPCQTLDAIRQISNTDCDRERAELLDLGTDYDRERARERAADLTLNKGDLTMEIEDTTQCSRRRIPNPIQDLPTVSEAQAGPAVSEVQAGPPPPPPPARGRAPPGAEEDEVKIAKSAPPPRAQVTAPPKDLQMPIETAEQFDSRVAKIFNLAGLTQSLNDCESLSAHRPHLQHSTSVRE